MLFRSYCFDINDLDPKLELIKAKLAEYLNNNKINLEKLLENHIKPNKDIIKSKEFLNVLKNIKIILTTDDISNEMEFMSENYISIDKINQLLQSMLTNSEEKQNNEDLINEAKENYESKQDENNI